MYNRPLGGFGQGWQGNNRGRGGGWGNQRGMYGGRGNYMNRGGMRPQSWGPMTSPMGSYGNQWSSNQNPAWGAPMGQQQGMNYAGAVKNEAVKQEPGKPGPRAPGPGQVRPPQQRPGGKDGGPKSKKLKLEQMGFGNMGSGFGCSLFVPNQGEEMPTMLQMGYAGEAPGKVHLSNISPHNFRSLFRNGIW